MLLLRLRQRSSPTPSLAKHFLTYLAVTLTTVICFPQSPGQMYAGLSQQIDFAALPEPGDRFSLETLIGEGTYGEVHAAKDREQNGTSGYVRVG